VAHESLSQLVAAAWDHALKTTPSDTGGLYVLLGGGPRRSYRDRLDAVAVNYFGDPIPRIEIVRRNLEAFKAGNTRVWRGPYVRDRRQRGERRRRG
jgi:hypothetical protein